MSSPEAEFMNYVEVSGNNLQSSHRLEISVYNVYITNQFKTNFCSRGGG